MAPVYRTREAFRGKAETIARNALSAIGGQQEGTMICRFHAGAGFNGENISSAIRPVRRTPDGCRTAKSWRFSALNGDRVDHRAAAVEDGDLLPGLEAQFLAAGEGPFYRAPVGVRDVGDASDGDGAAGADPYPLVHLDALRFLAHLAGLGVHNAQGEPFEDDALL